MAKLDLFKTTQEKKLGKTQTFADEKTEQRETEAEKIRVTVSKRKKRKPKPAAPKIEDTKVLGVSDVERKQSREPILIEDIKTKQSITDQKLQSRQQGESITLKQATSRPRTKQVFFETDTKTGKKEVVAIVDKSKPLTLPPSIITADKKRTSIEKISGFLGDLGKEFKAGFTLKESPTQSLTPEQQFQFSLTGINPLTGKQETRISSRVQQLAGLLGTQTALASEVIGKGVGSTISKVPGVKQVTTSIGNILTSKPAVATLTVLAGKELVDSSKEGSTEFARTGVNIIKDVTLFAGVLKQLPVSPIKTPIDVLFQNPLKLVKVEVPVVETTKTIFAGETGVEVKVPVEKTTQTFRSLGLDIGTKAQPLITTTPEGVKFGTPKIQNRIDISDLSSPIAQPETALGGKVLVRALDFTPAEITRLESIVGASRILGTDKGFTPKDIFFNVKGLKNPEATSKAIEQFTIKEDGVIFGSAVTQRLPEGFINKEIGDVDIFVQGKTVSQIEPRLKSLTEQLKGLGEDVKFNPEKLSIDFSKGGKVLEVKSGIDQDVLGLQDEAPGKFLGFDVSETKGIKFGQTQSITAGQQFLRKGAASSIVSPPTKGAEFPSFTEGGLVGKITTENPRGTKDIAGFIQTGEGLAAIREGSLNPLTRAKGRRAFDELKTFKESFTPQQQKDIDIKLESLVGTKTTQRISVDSKTSLSVVERLASPTFPRSVERIGDFNLDKSKSLIESPKSKTTVSPSPIISETFIPISDISPSTISDSSFIPISSFPSPSDTSPSVRSKSPSPSVKSPISNFTSPISSFPSPSPRSPSISSASPLIESPIRPPSLDSFISPSLRSPSRSPSLGGFGEPLFNVNVGSEDNKFFFQKQDLTLQEAIQFGRSKVKGTAAASFKITSKDNINRNFASQIESSLGSEFTRSKKDDDIFVQKREFRIGSIGEKQDITLLGLKAISGKNINSFF